MSPAPEEAARAGGSVEALRARLERSRGALLAALGRLTEPDFAAEVEPGLSVTALLAGLAPAERAAIAKARRAAGVAPRPQPATSAARDSALPPQVIHDLAGARHETVLFLDAPSSDPPAESVPWASLEAIAEREEAAAERIRGRFAST